MRAGKLSDTLREGMKLYLNKKKTGKFLCKLEKLQSESQIKPSIEEEVKLIREDRERQ